MILRFFKTNKLLAISLLLLPANLHAWSIYREANGGGFNKWSLNGRPIKSDQDRDILIAASVAFPSGTLTTGNFVSIAPTQDEIALTTSTFTDWPKQDSQDLNRFPVCAWNAQNLTLTWDGQPFETLRIGDRIVNEFDMELVRLLLTRKKALRKVYLLDLEKFNQLTTPPLLGDAETLAETNQYKSHGMFLRRVYLTLP